VVPLDSDKGTTANMSNEKSNENIPTYGYKNLAGYVILGDKSATLLLYFLCWAARGKTTGAYKTGESDHSQYAIQSQTGLNRKTIRKATAMLKDLGLITCKARGKRDNLLYWVNYGKLAERAEAGKRTLSERCESKWTGGEGSLVPIKLGKTAPRGRVTGTHEVGQIAPTGRVKQPRGEGSLVPTNYESTMNQQMNLTSAGTPETSGSIFSGIEAPSDKVSPAPAPTPDSGSRVKAPSEARKDKSVDTALEAKLKELVALRDNTSDSATRSELTSQIQECRTAIYDATQEAIKKTRPAPAAKPERDYKSVAGMNRTILELETRMKKLENDTRSNPNSSAYKTAIAEVPICKKALEYTRTALSREQALS
jgi:hypothetical protein